MYLLIECLYCAFEVLAKAKQLEAQGRDVIHLEIGEPDFNTPRNIIDAGCRALNTGFTHYTPAPGIPEVRETIVNYVRTYKNVDAHADDVVIVPGAKPIIFFSLLALVNPGDEVIFPNPGFPIYESVIRFAGAKQVPIPLREEKQFRLDVDELARLITGKTKMLIINSPGNPTGGVLTSDDVRAIADLVRGKGIFVLSDEIYERITYGNQHPLSIASLPGMKDWTIIADGFSKSYAMTGWRLGYGVMHHKIAARIALLMVNSNSCTAAFTQIAGQEGMLGPQNEVDNMVAEFIKRREIIVKGLNAIPGVSCLWPEGAFYAFPNFKSFNKTSKELADYLLNQAGVACLSGSSFGSSGEGFIRFSYANSIANIESALDRIDSAVSKL